MISQIFDNNSFKVLALFALSPGSRFRRKEIKEKTRMNNIPLDSALSRLVSSGVVNKERNFYHINLENKHSEQIMNMISSQHKQLKSLPLDVYFLITDVVTELLPFKGTEIWLFGSYSKMIYKETSDIDIALLESDTDKEHIKKIFRRLEKQYGKKIEEHFFERDGFYKNKNDPLVKDILQNGTRLL